MRTSVALTSFLTLIIGSIAQAQSPTTSTHAAAPEFKWGRAPSVFPAGAEMALLHAHFAEAQGVTVVQVHALGPFVLTYVNPADMPHTTPGR